MRSSRAKFNCTHSSLQKIKCSNSQFSRSGSHVYAVTDEILTALVYHFSFKIENCSIF